MKISVGHINITLSKSFLYLSIKNRVGNDFPVRVLAVIQVLLYKSKLFIIYFINVFLLLHLYHLNHIKKYFTFILIFDAYFNAYILLIFLIK